jgi:hypothetical protein
MRAAAEPLRPYVLEMIAAALAEAERTHREKLAAALGVALQRVREGQMDEHLGHVPIVALAAVPRAELVPLVVGWLASLPVRWPDEVREALEQAAR